MPSTDEELHRIEAAKMRDDELVDLTTPYYKQLKEQGDMYDNETIDDKQLKAAQTPVANAANAVIKLRLKKEEYRAVWDFQDTYRADKWAHKDYVREMKRQRRAKLKAARAARKAEKKAAKAERKATKKANKTAMRAAKAVCKAEKKEKKIKSFT